MQIPTQKSTRIRESSQIYGSKIRKSPTLTTATGAQTQDLIVLRDQLSRAIAAIDALQPNDTTKANPNATALKGILYQPKRQRGVDWPRLLPRGVAPTPSKIFGQAQFQDAFLGGDSLEIYFGAGAGANSLGKAFSVPTYKVGTARLGRLVTRFAEHKTDEYAALWLSNGIWTQEEGFDDWWPSTITTNVVVSANSPIRPTSRSLVVSLPPSISSFTFEQKLRAEIAHCALYRWILTEDGIRHCRRLGVDPARARRATAYNWGAATRLSIADEIYIVRPHIDADALIVIAEKIILRELGLIMMDPSRKA